MWNHVCKLFIVLFSFTLAACGGGGGGGGGSSTPPANGNFNLSATAITLTGPSGSSTPHQFVYLTDLGPAAYNVYIGTPVGTSWPSWLDANLVATSLTAGYAELWAYTYGLSVGTYKTTIRVLSVDSKGNPLVYKDFTVTLVVTAASSSSSSSFGSSVSSSSAASSSSGFSSSGSSSFSSSSVAASSVAAAISASPSSMSFGGSAGRSFSTSVPASTINLAANKSGGSWSWSIQSKPAWLTAETASAGTLSDATASALNFRANPAGMSPGSYNGSLVLQATVAGSTVTTTVPVNVKVDKRKLIASDVGVAFTKTPSWSRLTRNITVNDNFGSGTWTATSDQSWLTVSPSGSSGGSLALSANPAGLAANSLQTATVTIASDNGAAAETITVGLWNGNSTPSAQASISGSFTHVAADPVRPWIYASSNSGTVAIYNIYQQTLVGTIATTGNTSALEVSADGKRLYAVAGNSIIVIDPVARTQLGTLNNGVTSAVLRHTRVNGEAFLVASSGGKAFKLATSAETGHTTCSSCDPIAVSPDGKVLLAGARYDLDYTDVTGSLTMSIGSSVNGGNNDIAITRDGLNVVTASGAPYNFPVYALANNATVTTLAGNPYPNNAKVASDGRIFVGSMNFYDPVDLWVYRPDFSLVMSTQVHDYALPVNHRQLVPSGDALMAAATLWSGTLKLVPIGPDTAGSSSVSTTAVPASVLGMSTSGSDSKLPLSPTRKKAQFKQQ